MATTRLRTQTWQVRAVVAVLAALALVAAVLVPAAGAGPGGGAAGPDPSSAAGSGGSDRTYQVTLVTGDVVTWQALGDGQGVATVAAGPDRAFQTIEVGDDYYVIPVDVAPLVGTALDRELFNIPGLVEQGYHDAATDGIPVVVTGAGLPGERATNTAPDWAGAVTVERRLDSVGGFAGTVDHEDADRLGEELATAAREVADGGMGAAAARQLGTIWLDRKVEVQLDESVPQTGAPEAWAAGYDGTGTTIAILDTGIDETHPDIGDKVVASANFSGTDSVADHHGHGTHVAATAAGTGDASGGLRKGVAPGADLVNVKVLDDNGFGSVSGIIAGMEWAAEQDVDVISMSLGGGPTDGTDPMSQAVNAITEEHGVLFVIAAGNSGPFEQSVEAPGVADAALTVGAVDKQSALATFSGRGPRVGDFAIKPDITAPGVSIVAARAAGTSMGTPVDDLYTAANGTSMATPHVAGAAAILLQQHPDWDPATVKGALVGTAEPAAELTVYEQGGGELDVAAASTTDVVATPGTLNLGYHQYPHDDTDPVTETLTYTNHGDAEVTLDIAVQVADEEGNPAADGMVTVEPTTLTLAPGASGEVAVTVDVGVGAESLYSGTVVASVGGEPVTTTPTGFYKEGEMYQLTVEGVARDGRPARGTVDVVDVTDTTAYLESASFVDGTATLRLPPGTYSVMGVINTLTPDDLFYVGQTMMGDPEIEITGDTTLTWDAREAAEITVDTGDDAQMVGHTMGYHRAGSELGSYTHSWVGGTWPFSAGATDAAGSGFFEFYTKYEMHDAGASRFYDLVFPEPDAIPGELDYVVDRADLVTLETDYHSDAPDHEYGWTRASWRPYEFFAVNILRYLPVPTEQTELVTADDTRYMQTVYAQTPFTGSLNEAITTYEPGDHREVSWFASPSTPTLFEPTASSAGTLPVREGDVLRLYVTEWGDAYAHEQQHTGHLDTSVDTAQFRLYQDGALVTEAPRAYAEFPVAAGDSRIRLELDVAREADWWTTSVRTSTAWELDSSTTAEATPLPLLQVEYDLGLGLDNSRPHPSSAGGPATVGIEVRHPRGVTGAEIEGARVWVSYDDGGSWRERPVRETSDGSFEVVLDRRPGGTHASLRVHAWDADGNTVEQDVIRAFALGQR